MRQSSEKNWLVARLEGYVFVDILMKDSTIITIRHFLLIDKWKNTVKIWVLFPFINY